MPADYLHARALELLDAASDGVTLARTGNPAPGRQFVHHGIPSTEGCDQLTVHLDPQRPVRLHSVPDRPLVSKQKLVVPMAQYVVQLWRCWPSSDDEGAALDADTFTANTLKLNKDGWALYTQILSEHFASTLFDGVACEHVVVGDLRLLGPTGEMAGWEVRVDLALNDGGP